MNDKRILVVDDDPDFGSVLVLALHAEGYAAELAASGRDALRLQRERPAQILITDLVMPEQDGFELIESFRREFAQTKIVVVSGAERLDTPLYLSAARLIGVDATLRKPFEVEALLEVLRAL